MWYVLRVYCTVRECPRKRLTKFPVNMLGIFYITLPEKNQKQGFCSKYLEKNYLSKGPEKLPVFSFGTEVLSLITACLALWCCIYKALWLIFLGGWLDYFCLLSHVTMSPDRLKWLTVAECLLITDAKESYLMANYKISGYLLTGIV